MAKLMNVGNERSDSIDASTIEDAVRIIQVEKLQCAMNPTKIRKASGTSGVILEMFKASGKKCLKSWTNIFNDKYIQGYKLPEGWTLSSLVLPYSKLLQGNKVVGTYFKLYEIQNEI